MKKSITTLTVMSLTLQANANINLDQAKDSVSPNGASVTLNKDVTLSNDADNSGGVSFGDTLTYQIDTNTTTIGASGAFLSDDIDLNTSLVVGSVVTDLGTVVTGNTPGDTNIDIDMGTIAINSTVQVEFDVTVNHIPAGNTIEISNQANLSTTNLGNFVTDDPNQPGGADPTIIAGFGPPKIIPTTTNIGLFALILAMMTAVKGVFSRRKKDNK
jgi:hypothetical protein